MSLNPTPGTAAEPPIEQGWWPAIDLVLLRNACRLDGTVTTARLRHAAVAAVLHVNAQAGLWRGLQEAAGYANLAAVPASVVDGASTLVHHYLRAVYAAVQAELIERYRDVDTTARGDKRAEDMDTRVDDARRDLRWALSDLQGKPRTVVDLI